jgi:hypothetical protein
MTAPVQSERGALMAFWTAIDTDYVLRFQQWHNCEHMLERTSIPGFQAGHRYRAADCTPRFLILYDTDDAAVLTSEAYLAALNAPTPWTRESLTHFRDAVRNVYRPIAQAGTYRSRAAPFLFAARFDLAGTTHIAARESALAHRLDEILDLASGGRARFLVFDEAGSSVDTSERRIYGGGLGKQSHLLLVECATEAARAKAATSFSKTFALEAAAVEAESWWLEFTWQRAESGE